VGFVNSVARNCGNSWPPEDTEEQTQTTSSASPDTPTSSAAAENDRFSKAGGQIDTVDCGAGCDIVIADSRDVVSKNCEKLIGR
jgi:hypothetical protein